MFLLGMIKTTSRTSRDIAQKFNNDFNCKDFFPLPEPLISSISRVMSLRDGTKKWAIRRVRLFNQLKDSTDEQQEIKKAKSDLEPIPDDIKLLEKTRGIKLLNIYAELSKTDLKKTISEMSGKEYSFFKQN